MQRLTYKTAVEWTGNKGAGTYDYRSYSRNHNIHIANKVLIKGSSDSSFRGEESRHSPEDLFLSSISACHMLWYLHLCADHGVLVLKYVDEATGSLDLNTDTGGAFSLITLHPSVEISKDSDVQRALSMHTKAHDLCFIANSCKVDIDIKPIVKASI